MKKYSTCVIVWSPELRTLKFLFHLHLLFLCLIICSMEKMLSDYYFKVMENSDSYIHICKCLNGRLNIAKGGEGCRMALREVLLYSSDHASLCSIACNYNSIDCLIDTFSHVHPATRTARKRFPQELLQFVSSEKVHETRKKPLTVLTFGFSLNIQGIVRRVCFSALCHGCRIWRQRENRDRFSVSPPLKTLCVSFPVQSTRKKPRSKLATVSKLAAKLLVRVCCGAREDGCLPCSFPFVSRITGSEGLLERTSSNELVSEISSAGPMQVGKGQELRVSTLKKQVAFKHLEMN